MGLFSRNKEENQQTGYKFENEREAWIAIMYLIATTDGDWSDAETDAMSRIIVFKSFFDGYDYIAILKKMIAAKQAIGENKLLELAAPMISEQNKATLLTVSVDLVMADGVLGRQEETIIEKIIDKLGIDQALAERIIEVITYKNKYGKVIVDSGDDDD
jgi:uncharacterized tellurite resistance protein B-like protein